MENDRREFDLVLRGGQVVLEDRIEGLDIGIRDGKIAALLAPGVADELGCDVVDADGQYVLPGAIDTHTHVAWPLAGGDKSLDSFASASAAAAKSGTTTILDFVPPHDGVGHIEAARARLEEAAGNSSVDYSFRPILTPGASADIEALAELGLRSFKIFTTYDGMRLSDGEISKVMDAIGRVQGLAGFHAENHELVEFATNETIEQIGPQIKNFPASRPELAEEAAIDLVALYAREKAVPIFIFHVSGAAGVRAVERARALGAMVQAETCTHYLTTDESIYSSPDGWKFVITPPIRNLEEQAVLWEALREGDLTSIGSDHCAYGQIHKNPGGDDFTAMTAGAPGIEARVPLIWSEGVGKGRLTPAQFAQVTATGPAKTFGLFPRKGTIRVGSDADLTVIDPHKEWEWTPGTTMWASDYEPYAGRGGKGAVTATLLRGNVIARDGELLQAGTGEFLPQAPINGN